MKAIDGMYLSLIALTLVTYFIGEVGVHSLMLSLGVFAIAIIKGAIISEYFMQLKLVRGIWRMPILIWLLILVVVIFTAFNV